MEEEGIKKQLLLRKMMKILMQKMIKILKQMKMKMKVAERMVLLLISLGL
jgi:hypothetical protein